VIINSPHPNLPPQVGKEKIHHLLKTSSITSDLVVKLDIYFSNFLPLDGGGLR